jgi:membrane peptidoglycan carboxypeptidase
VGYTPKLSTAVWVGYPNNNNLPVGFGGTVAAPIWHDYMQIASGGYCGDWTAPATPWTGTAFTGPHSTAPPAPKLPKINPLNPQLFAQPPQAKPPKTPKPANPAPTPLTPGRPRAKKK